MEGVNSIESIEGIDRDGFRKVLTSSLIISLISKLNKSVGYTDYRIIYIDRSYISSICFYLECWIYRYNTKKII